jgi:phosphoserine phosphatase RsbU/P
MRLVLDFARGRLGGGLISQKEPDEQIAKSLNQIIAEFRFSQPELEIETRYDLREPIVCDPNRVAQLFSNLLGNAVTHGKPGKPIIVEARTEDGIFELSVTNEGDPIPQATMSQLFKPFYRGTVRKSLQGLGLGLFIASEIARSHAGTLEVKSESGITRFTFRMPISSQTSVAA